MSFTGNQPHVTPTDSCRYTRGDLARLMDKNRTEIEIILLRLQIAPCGQKLGRQGKRILLYDDDALEAIRATVDPPVNPSCRHTRGDLCRLSGYSLATIKVIIKHTIIDPPCGESRKGAWTYLYSDHHLEQIRQYQNRPRRNRRRNAVIEQTMAPDVSLCCHTNPTTEDPLMASDQSHRDAKASQYR